MSEITNFRGEAVSVQPEHQSEAEVQDLIERVAERVRRARESKGIPRRVLSETSGVSPRYIAQLEAGKGNISIALLQRIAAALDHRIEWLVGEEDPWTSDALRIADQYRSATVSTQSQVNALFDSDAEAASRANRICLIGVRGAGKSTLGRMAGARLDVPFVEVNKEIELAGGMPMGEIMDLYGQEGYRKLEADALDRVIQTYDAMILAVAGGIVAEPAIYNKLLGQFHTIWIKATPEEHMERVRAQGDERPMAGDPEAMTQLRTILTSREKIYERAQAQLDTTGASEEASLGQLLRIIEDQRFLF